MSRGGTRKARAEQEERRRKQRREAQASAKAEKKQARKRRTRAGRGRAALLHLSGFAAPFVLAFGLLRAGMASNDPPPYWLDGLIGDPNASYLSEPGGFLYMAVVFALSAGIFAVVPAWLWRRIYRSRSVLERDRSSVDTAFTMMAVTAIAWVIRAFAGYGDSLAALAVVMSILAVYVPIFSALLTVGMPVVKGSGRIGGILPTFMRMSFTERYLMTDEQREELRRFREREASEKAGGGDGADSE